MLPFSAGPRNCIGEVFARTEMQVHLMTVASRIRLRYVKRAPLEFEAGVNLRSRHELHDVAGNEELPLKAENRALPLAPAPSLATNRSYRNCSLACERQTRYAIVVTGRGLRGPEFEPGTLHRPWVLERVEWGRRSLNGIRGTRRALFVWTAADSTEDDFDFCDFKNVRESSPTIADGSKNRVETWDCQMQGHPASSLVSVIIPTLHRPTLLTRALASVFRQTWRELEVIVVVDGPDPETIAVLQTIDDPRLRVIVNPRSLTAAGARNAGMDHAKGEWIAFLDDDDEWAPEKLAKQMAYAADRGPVLITCLSRVVTPAASFVRPQVIYDNLQPIDEYLFDRRSPVAGQGFIQTSSYLLPRALCCSLRFRTDTPHDDWDYLLRLSKQQGVRVETVPEILVTLYVDDTRPSLSKSGTWLASLEWAERIRPLLTRRAYGGFCLGVVAPRAAKERAYRAAAPLLYQSFRHGSPRLWRVAAFLGEWLAPRGVLARVRQNVSLVRDMPR